MKSISAKQLVQFNVITNQTSILFFETPGSLKSGDMTLNITGK